MYRRLLVVVTVVLLSLLSFWLSYDARTATTADAAPSVAVDGTTYVLSGGNIRPLGKVTINATVLDGSNTRLSRESKEDGTFSFSMPIKKNTAVMFTFNKPGFHPSTVTALYGERKSSVHVVLLQDLQAVRAVKDELGKVLEQYRKVQ